jgi:CubicO group peptidase (beta-lactamase class C family)
MQSRAHIDGVLRQAVDANEVPGIVAMAAMDTGLLYEGAFGTRDLGNMEPGPNGRSAGTVSWAGLLNSYYWLDPVKRITGAILTQILPFADHRAVTLYSEFERGVYEGG